LDETRPGTSEVETAVRGSPALGVRLFAPGTEIGRRYEVRSVLGTGGSAVVYEAFDRELKRRVALKVLRTDRTSEAALKRFRREVAVARDAAGPRLVRVFDIGQAGDTVFLTMELVEGESLRELLQRGPLAPQRAAELAAEVLRALADLHALGIVHRDVKPGNVLLAESGEVKLADFGLARHWEGTETRVTETEGLVGTVEYLSPEQALGDVLDARSDLYAVGVVLFEMLAGKVPLRGDSAIGTIVAHIRQEPPDVRKLRPETPSWLAAVVARLLAKDRERRYAASADVLADLEARRATHGPRRWGRIAAAAGGAAALLLLGAAIVPSLPWNRPRFMRLVSDGSRTARALDSEGRALWSREASVVGVDILFAHTGPKGAPEVVALEGGPPGKEKALRFLDPETGRTLRRRLLAWDPNTFAPMPDTFHPTALAAYDVDGDGRDELAFAFSHSLWWPGVGFVQDVAGDRTAVTFFSSGHMRPCAAADVDADGRKEVLFRGFANRMGMNGALAALRVPPLRSPPPGEALGGVSVVSPDRVPLLQGQGGLLWYSLVPAAAAYPTTMPSLLPERRVVALGLLGGGKAEWTFDGFAVRPLWRRGATERNAFRNRAYDALREVQRLRSTGSVESAFEEIALATSLATAAEDDLLVEWIERTRGALLASSRRLAEAEDVFAAVLERTSMTANVAWEAGRAFHLAGDPVRAVAWYRRGFSGSAARLQIGRSPRDISEGIVLALGEQRRWGDALAECDRMEAAYPEDGLSASWYRTYALWRSGRPVEPPAQTAGDLDTWRVWALESRLARGTDPGSLVDGVAALRRTTTDVGPLLDSLEAELRAALGRKDEARQLAAAALEACRRGAASDPVLRSHLDLVAERARKLGAGPAAAAARP